MSWYKSGTITVTEGVATVVGVGTSWVDAGVINPGDILNGPDGRIYELLSIQSNTGLTLAGNYLGGTLGGQAYAIVLVGLLPSALAVKAQEAFAAAIESMSAMVRFNAAMGLSEPQKLNARTNIGVRPITVNTSPPSGIPSDGDQHIQYTAMP